MRNPRTTVFGALAAAGFAAAELPGLPHEVHLVALILGALSLALFGFSAEDAPRAERPRPAVLFAALAAVALVVTAGCSTTVPIGQPGQTNFVVTVTVTPVTPTPSTNQPAVQP